MIAARKTDSKNEDTKERVRARAVVTTDTGEGMPELGQQIAKLMAGTPVHHLVLRSVAQIGT